MSSGVSATVRLNPPTLLSGEAMLPLNCKSDRRPYSLPAYARDVSQAPGFITASAIGFTELPSSMLLSVLVDTIPKGLLVLSIDRTIVYWNQTAKRLCQTLPSSQRYQTTLPTVIAELWKEVVEADSATEPVVVEYQTPDDRSFRLTACWLTAGASDHLSAAFSNQTYILVTLEDRDEVLQQDIQAEQKRFHLTNREAEVWLLLKREYSYQAIATTLHISLNTVKTHIRNIHAKRHPYQSLPA